MIRPGRILLLLWPLIVNYVLGDFGWKKGICLKTETYESTIYKTVITQQPKTEKRWCWSVINKFQCPYTVFIPKSTTVPKTIQRERTVKVCCDGYERSWKTDEFFCTPHCSGGCGAYGICSDPDVCFCEPGYYGPACEEECPPGLWGANCAGVCECFNEGECDRLSGKCTCMPGWQGDRCISPCPSGFYGFKCKEQCGCPDENCSHVTGECLTTTAEEEETSTTEATVTTTTTETTTTEAAETTSLTVAMETTFLTEVTTKEAINALSVTESTMAKEVNTTLISETTPTTADTTEEIFKKKLMNVSSGEKSFDGVKSEEVNSNELPKEPRILVVKVGHKERKNSEEDELTSTENNREKKTSKLIYFVPSLTVLSGVSILILFITARWLIVWHRKKVRKMTMEVEEKIFHPDGRRKSRIESIFLVSDVWENPVYLPSGFHLNEKAPVLQTFKPLAVETSKGSDADGI